MMLMLFAVPKKKPTKSRKRKRWFYSKVRNVKSNRFLYVFRNMVLCKKCQWWKLNHYQCTFCEKNNLSWNNK